jgi:hypothetical protein
MRSLLFSSRSPHAEPLVCAAGRQEVPITIKKHGRLYRLVLRDKICVEDPYLVLVKAEAFAIRTGEPYAAPPPPRTVRDWLIKSSLVVV